MPQINELREQISRGLAPRFADLGLDRVFDDVVWSHSPGLIRIVQISFLDSHHASYFGSSTASFSIEFGGLYGPANLFEAKSDFPRVHYCQVRGKLHGIFGRTLRRRICLPQSIGAAISGGFGPLVRT